MIGAQSSSRPATGASTAPQDRSHLSQPKPTTFNRDQVPRGVGIGVAIGGSDVTPDPTPNASPQRRNGRVRAGSNAEMTRDASIWTRGKAIPAGIRVDVPSGMGTGMEGISRYGPNGHGGTNFTVGNVSNGMLYLRQDHHNIYPSGSVLILNLQTGNPLKCRTTPKFYPPSFNSS